MIKFITERKNKEEEKRKNNKGEFNSKTKKATKNLTLQAIRTMKYGIKFSLNKNPLKGPSRKSRQRITSL